MLTQQLRQMAAVGILTRSVHATVPPKVEYRLKQWGQSLCPALLDQLLTWTEQQPRRVPSPGLLIERGSTVAEVKGSHAVYVFGGT
jgi:DNA-binding HxlR family transcriptional regulator